MLYLNEKDIEKLITHEEVVNVVEDTMGVYETGNFVQPDRITINKDKETYLYMPCFTDDVRGTKILTLFDENAAKGIPTIRGFGGEMLGTPLKSVDLRRRNAGDAAGKRGFAAEIIAKAIWIVIFLQKYVIIKCYKNCSVDIFMREGKYYEDRFYWCW